jgi:hypothetical protein
MAILRSIMAPVVYVVKAVKSMGSATSSTFPTSLNQHNSRMNFRRRAVYIVSFALFIIFLTRYHSVDVDTESESPVVKEPAKVPLPAKQVQPIMEVAKSNVNVNFKVAEGTILIATPMKNVS